MQSNHPQFRFFLICLLALAVSLAACGLPADDTSVVPVETPTTVVDDEVGTLASSVSSDKVPSAPKFDVHELFKPPWIPRVHLYMPMPE
jgi:hypothetical protein